MQELQSLTTDIGQLTASIEKWTFWNLLMLSLAGIAAVGVLVTTIPIVNKTKTLTALNERKFVLIDGQNKVDIADANTRASQAVERAARAIEAATEARIASLRIEGKLAWREIDSKHFNEYVSTLSRFPNASVRIEMIEDNDDEVKSFVVSLKKMFVAAHWTVKDGPTTIPLHPARGILFVMDQFTPEGKALTPIIKRFPQVSIINMRIADGSTAVIIVRAKPQL